MPKIKALILATKIDHDGRMLAKIQCDGKLPANGTYVSLKWGKIRSLSQNALYFRFLHWLIENGLKEHGHFSEQALHENLRDHFLADKLFDRGQFKAIEEATTTDLTVAQFGEYFDKVDEFVHEFFGIDTAPFWAEYRENHQ